MNKTRAIQASVVLVVAIACWLIFSPDSPEMPEVPLGVEHAVTITYTGSELAVKPYRFGVPVNLRIAEVTEIDGVRTYDIRYMLNTGGEFDITEYLGTKDGTVLSDLPQFKVFGLDQLSQNMDQRVEAIEEMGIDIWPYYYQTMGAIVAAWIVWFLLLVFWGRKKPELLEESVAVETFYDVLQSFLIQIEDGSIDDKGKAQFEMLVIHWWRDQLGYADLDMHDVMHKIGSDATSGSAFQVVEQWLHNPKASVSVDELLESLRPFSVRPEPAVS